MGALDVLVHPVHSRVFRSQWYFPETWYTRVPCARTAFVRRCAGGAQGGSVGASLPGEAGLLEGELAHVHVVPASDQEDGRLTLVQLHLSPNPAS